MAKGSLAGNADPVLVKMAYLAANANVPGDYSDHYKTMVETHDAFWDEIENAATAYVVSKQVDVAALDTAMKMFDEPLSLQAIDADYNMMYMEVENQRELWKASNGFKNDPKGLSDWNRKNTQIVNNYKGNQDVMKNIKAGYDNGLYAKDQMAKGDLNFMTNLANYQANQNGKSGSYNQEATDFMSENQDATAEDLWNHLGVVEEGEVVKYHNPTTGEYTYVSKVINENGVEELKTVKQSELKGHFDKHLKADDAFVGVQELDEAVAQFSHGKDVKYSKYSSNYRNQLEDIIDSGMETNKNTLRYLCGKKSGVQSMAFDQALRSGKVPIANEILGTLQNQEGWQGDDGDGVLDEGDFATVENYNAVVDSILNGELDKESPNALKNMYLDYTEDTLFSKTHDLNRTVENKGGTGNYIVNKSQIDAATFNRAYKPHVNFLNAGTTGKTDGLWNVKKAPNDTLYRGSDEEGWEMKAVNETTYTEATKSEIAATIGLDMSHGLNFELTGGARGGEVEEQDLPLNQAGEAVENGAYGSLFQMDDDDAIIEMKTYFPPNYSVSKGTHGVGKFFGVDKVSVYDQNGKEIEGSPFDVGYDNAGRANKEAQRFNTVAAKHLKPL